MTTFKELKTAILEALVYSGNAATITNYLAGVGGAEIQEERPNKMRLFYSTGAARQAWSPSGASIAAAIRSIRDKIASATGFSINAKNANDIRANTKKIDFKVLSAGRKVCDMTIEITRSGVDIKVEDFDRADRGKRDRGGNAQGGRQPRDRQDGGQAPARPRPNNRPAPAAPADNAAEEHNYGVTIGDLYKQGDGDGFFFGMAKFTDVQDDGDQYVKAISYVEIPVSSDVAYKAQEMAEGGAIQGVGSAAQINALLGTGAAKFDSWTVLNPSNLQAGGFMRRGGNWAGKGVSFATLSLNTVKGRKMKAIIEKAQELLGGGAQEAGRAPRRRGGGNQQPTPAPRGRQPRNRNQAA